MREGSTRLHLPLEQLTQLSLERVILPTANKTMALAAEFREGCPYHGARGMAEVWVPGQFMIGTLLMLFFGLPSMTRSL